MTATQEVNWKLPQQFRNSSHWTNRLRSTVTSGRLFTKATRTTHLGNWSHKESGTHSHQRLTGFRLWRQYWRQFWGYIFWGSIFPSKMGPFAPFSATIQALSRTRTFLSSENERKLLCMGRTFTVARPYLLNNCPFQLSFSWESNPARVKASGSGAKF
jgi:hypothetical protein